MTATEWWILAGGKRATRAKIVFLFYMSTWTDLLTRNLGKMFSNLNNSQDVDFVDSTSKSKTKSLVSSVPFRLPTAQTSFVSLARILHTTPPDPPESRATKFRINSPVLTSQSLTVPSSEDVITKRLLNWRQVTADWCLFGPEMILHKLK